ncbi:CMD domain protein [Variovorax ginsengisoli]|uniref:CMD domain protein n=1 Tax=Variovorax ginsengisoli TaxID=363844 RepID=A0ABT9S3E6_9BURK|nr:CMD domain protein [Variovorax ginsengisoli]MDP9898760.1 CMD domain protein [Variovorax ginsengisoli]
MTATSIPDVIDQLAGIHPGDALDAIRAQRPQARQHAQQSYLALFHPGDPSLQAVTRFTVAERFAVAAYTAALHGQGDFVAFYGTRLSADVATSGWLEVLAAEAAQSAARGPYGAYPSGPLSAEDVSGPVHAVGAAHRALLGDRLSAALAHAHLLVLHPRDAAASALQALLDAGWSTTDIVTLSQLVAFLSFQIRVVAGLRTLAALTSTSTVTA